MNIADEEKTFSMFRHLHDHAEGSGVALDIFKDYGECRKLHKE
jgi:hypothetical protein